MGGTTIDTTNFANVTTQMDSFFIFFQNCPFHKNMFRLHTNTTKPCLRCWVRGEKNKTMEILFCCTMYNNIIVFPLLSQLPPLCNPSSLLLPAPPPPPKPTIPSLLIPQQHIFKTSQLKKKYDSIVHCTTT